MSLISELQKIGFSEKEASVYLATLELAQASVQQIAKKARVNRTTSYFVLESLVKKGLISSYEHGKKTFYIATDPDALESLFEIQKKELEEQKKNYKKLLPQLRLIHNREEGKPVIRFFEGRQGLLHVTDEFFTDSRKDKESVRMVYPADRIAELFSDTERDKYRQKRLKLKIKSKVIYNKKAGELKSSSDGKRIKINSKEFPISADLAIYGDKVRIASLGKRLSAVLIKDKEIAKTLKSIFDLAWEAAQARGGSGR